MTWLRCLAIAVVISAGCVVIVPPRGERGGPVLAGDSISYVAMAGGSSATPAPFRYRIVVPTLARALPFEPVRALSIVSLASLVAAYTIVLRTSRRVGLSRTSACTGLVLAVIAAPHVYNYENPYLTDAMGILVVTACLHAVVTRRFPWFLAICAVGMGVREASIFAAPGWASTRQLRRTVLAILASLAVYVVLHLCIGPLSAKDPGPFKEFPARPVRDVAGDLLCSWHGLWFAVPLGLLLLRRPHRQHVGVMACSLTVGTLVTSFLATDTTRMTGPLFPIVVLGGGSFVTELWKRARWLTALLIGGSIAGAALFQPLRFVPPLATSATWRPLAVTLLTATALTGVARIVVPALRRGREEPSTGAISES